MSFNLGILAYNGPQDKPFEFMAERMLLTVAITK